MPAFRILDWLLGRRASARSPQRVNEAPYYTPNPQGVAPEDDTIRSDGFAPPYRGPDALDNFGNETDAMRRAYIRLYREEPSLKSAIEGKAESIAALDVTVQPADEDDPAAVAAAEWVDWAVAHAPHGWDGLILNTLLPAFLLGWSAQEIVLTSVSPDDSLEYPHWHGLKHCRPLNTEKLRLELDAYRTVLGVMNTVRGLASYPRRKVLLFTHNDLFHNPFGGSDAAAAYRDANCVDAAFRLWGYAVRVYGGPFLKGTYTAKDTRKKLEEALDAARQGGWITLPKGDDVEVINLATAASFDAFKEKIQKHEERVYMAVRGAYLPFMQGRGGEGETRGSSETSKGAGSDPKEYLIAQRVCRAINRDLVPHLVRPNFPPGTGLPQVTVGGVNWQETKTQLEVAKGLKELGLEVDPKYLFKITAMPPKPMAAAGAAAQQQPGAGGAPGQPPPDGGPGGGPSPATPLPRGGGGSGGQTPAGDGTSTVPPELLAAMTRAAQAGDWPAVQRLVNLGRHPEELAGLLGGGGDTLTFAAGDTTHRRDGEVWQGQSGRYFTLRGGRVVPAKNPHAEEPKGRDPAAPKRDVIADAKRAKAEREPARESARAAWREAVADPTRVRPEHLPALAEHLHALTRDELRDMGRALGRSPSGLKAEIVDRLLQHVGASPAALAPPTRADGTPLAPRREDVHTVDPKALKVDPDRFQYKVSGIKAGGVTDELKGTSTYNPELGGTLLAWRDPATGDDFVVNGHHRHELATRTGAPSVNVRYIDAPSAKEARARGALANIAEGRGTATDAAKYLRDSGQDVEHLKRAGISMSGKVAADAADLKDLSDGAFQKLTTGQLDEAKAAAVAKHLKDPKLQDTLFRKLERREDEGKDWSPREVETAAKKMARAGSVTEKGHDLFGDFEDEKSTFDQEVELESHVGRALQQTANDYAAVGSAGRAERVKGAGNTLAVEENRRRRAEAVGHAADFEREAGLKSPVSQAIKAGAAELAKAKTKKEKDDVKARTLAAVRGILAEGTGGVAPGGQPAPAQPRGGGAGGAGAPADGRAGGAGAAPAAAPKPAAVEPAAGPGAAPKAAPSATPAPAPPASAPTPPATPKRSALAPSADRPAATPADLNPHDPAHWDALAKAGNRGKLLEAAAKLGLGDQAKKLPASKIAAMLKEKAGGTTTPPPPAAKPASPPPPAAAVNPVEAATLARAKADFAPFRDKYLKGDPATGKEGSGTYDANGNLTGVTLNTDEWRDLFPEYTGTNAGDVHEASSHLNKQMYAEALQSMKGKGNNTMVVLAGGGGSGKGTAVGQHFDQAQYPIRLDQVSDNLPKLEQKLDEAKANGYGAEYVFVDRHPADAWSGVVGRAANMRKKGKLARTVPIEVALHANLAARKTAIDLLKKRLDIPASVIDNNHGPNNAHLITDRAEAIKHLESQNHNHDELLRRLRDDTLGLFERGEIPADIAEGLVGRAAVDARRAQPGQRAAVGGAHPADGRPAGGSG